MDNNIFCLFKLTMTATVSFRDTLTKFDVIDILFFIAISAFEDSLCLVNYIENRLHRFVICNTFGVVTFYDSSKLFWQFNSFFLGYLIIFNDIKHDFWGNNTQSTDFFLRKKRFVILIIPFFPIFFDGRL